MTNLGNVGNHLVASEYRAYVEKFPRGQCSSGVSGRKKVVVSSFGLYSGVNYNISDVIIKSFASDNNHEVNKTWVARREILVSGESVEFCFLSFDVKWDLSGALLAFEASHFKPDMILITGRSGAPFAYIEKGAVNETMKYSGYEESGSVSSSNTPESSWVLSDLPLGTELPMNWNNLKLGDRVRSAISSLGFDLIIPERARIDNNYICNNIALILLHFANGSALDLAGGLVKIPAAQFERQPVVGFFHFPPVDANHPDSLPESQVIGWQYVLLEIVAGTLF